MPALALFVCLSLSLSVSTDHTVPSPEKKRGLYASAVALRKQSLERLGCFPEFPSEKTSHLLYLNMNCVSP